MKQVKLIVITIVIILIGIINISQQQVNARNDNQTAADEQNPEEEFDVPQLPIGQIVPGETNTTSFQH
jgi:uncharacterized alpha/beta hydrolase family protein